MRSVGFLEIAFRWLLGNIDKGIYGLISIVLQGIFDLAGAELITNETVEAFAQRVYVILGIFMLFKLALSLINALVNPDILTDKQRGTDKIVIRVVGMLVMLVFVDDIYKELMIIQEKAIPVLPKLIIGYKITNDDNQVGDQFNGSVNTQSIGDTVAWTMYQGYFTYNPACEENSSHIENGKVKDAVREFSTVGEAVDAINTKCPSNSSIFLFDYFWLMPTISGAILLIILVGFAIDVAIRAFKLLILRMLAPIPIISYVDPKSSKDGAFANFIKIFTSTYLSLLLTLGTIYFGIFILKEVINNLLPTLSNIIGYSRASFLFIFLTIGLFFFLKQAPKFVKDILGIKPGPGSVGISGMLAGAAGLIGTRSLMGALGGFMAGADAASTAAVQGKQGPSGWGVGRDLAAQIRTGDRNAKGGIAHRLADFENRRAMQTSARRLGVTQGSIETAKNNMYAQEAAYYAMQRRYEEARLSGVVSQDKLQEMSKAMDDQRIVYNKAKSWYDKANKLGDQYRVNPTLREEIRRDGVNHRFNEDNWSPTADPGINPKATAASKDFDRIYNEVKPEIDRAAEAVMRSRSGSEQGAGQPTQTHQPGVSRVTVRRRQK